MRTFKAPTPHDMPVGRRGWSPYSDFHRERIRAHEKHDDGGCSMERKDWDDEAWLSVLVEEVGEVARVLCERRHGTYDPDRPEAQKALREELIQVGAMTAAWIDALDAEVRWWEGSQVPPDCCQLQASCPQQGKSVAEHCAAGLHCTSNTASCAAELSGDDHPLRCCICSVDLYRIPKP